MPHRLLRMIALGLWLPCLAACSAKLVGPAETDRYRTVVLLEHGRHSSLLLTGADRTRFRYAYADWQWYVEEQQGFVAGARALLIPTPSAFGRQVVEPARPGERLSSAIGVGVGQAHEFRADARQVDLLLDALERQFDASGSKPVYRAQRNLWFVPHPQPYTFGRNSNHMVAGWLRELGVEVRGNPALGHWRTGGRTQRGRSFTETPR